METIKNNKPLEIVPGITGYYAHGEKMTFGYVELLKGASIPAHQHPQEQITYIIEGELDMMIGKRTVFSHPECTGLFLPAFPIRQLPELFVN